MTGRPSFRVRAGLADPACVWFEAITFPGYYLQQQNFAAYLRATDGTAAFAPQHGLPEAGTHRSAHVPAGVRTPDQLSPAPRIPASHRGLRRHGRRPHDMTFAVGPALA